MITGLVLGATIPALALINPENMPLIFLIAWVFSVSFLGVWVGWCLQPRLIVSAPLRQILDC